jgi:hypothetical protein
MASEDKNSEAVGPSLFYMLDLMALAEVGKWIRSLKKKGMSYESNNIVDRAFFVYRLFKHRRLC